MRNSANQLRFCDSVLAWGDEADSHRPGVLAHAFLLPCHPARRPPLPGSQAPVAGDLDCSRTRFAPPALPARWPDRLGEYQTAGPGPLVVAPACGERFRRLS